MARVFALLIILITIVSSLPLLRLNWWMPADVSTHGAMIDRQMEHTMAGAGFAFVVSQFLLAAFVLTSSSSRRATVKTLPGGPGFAVAAAFLLVGIEVVALGIFGVKSWAALYLAAPSSNAIPIQVQAGQFAFYFRYPGPDGNFGSIHPDRISETAQNFFGLDPEHDAAAKDDIVTAEMAVPVDREIYLLMHSKDVGHSFFVPELRLQQDFVPGQDLSLHFTATKTGRYEILCTQLCGLGHYNMRAYLSVMSQADFDRWLEQQAAYQ
jgi:cytochrome c oxidase subunit II